MRLWTILPDEKLTDDRAYLLGCLKGVFDDVETTWVSRIGGDLKEASRPPDLILNLVSAHNRDLLDRIDTLAARYGIPLSPNSEAAWRTEDKRTYLDDYPDVIPPTRIAHDMVEIKAALAEFGGDIVVKDPFGMRGENSERVAGIDDLETARRMFAQSICGEQSLIVQPYLSGFAKGDKRIILQRSPRDDFEIIGHYMRKPPPGGWKSNIRNGGIMLRADITTAEREMALDIAARTGMDHVGLDLASHDGRLYYIEHNQGYGGIIDFDLDRGVRNVARCAEFLYHLAKHGRPDT